MNERDGGRRDGKKGDGTAREVEMSVPLGTHRLATPLMAAAGCAGFGHELVRWGGLEPFGALVTPSLTHVPQEAGEERVILESPSGIVHPHDTPNVGASTLEATRLPWEVVAPTPVVVSIAGDTSGDFAEAAAEVRRRTALRGVFGVEVNLSVPNVANSGRPFARDEYAATKVISRVREHLPRNIVLFVKLSLASDVVDMTRGVVKAGADAVVLGHPPRAVAIDTVSLRSRTRGHASMAGPALLPMTLGAVFELKAAMLSGRLPSAPIVAGGGISRPDDAVQALAAGASAVQIGSALFRDPRTGLVVDDGVRVYCERHGTTPADLVGAAHS